MVVETNVPKKRRRGTAGRTPKRKHQVRHRRRHHDNKNDRRPPENYGLQLWEQEEQDLEELEERRVQREREEQEEEQEEQRRVQVQAPLPPPSPAPVVTNHKRASPPKENKTTTTDPNPNHPLSSICFNMEEHLVAISAPVSTSASRSSSPPTTDDGIARTSSSSSSVSSSSISSVSISPNAAAAVTFAEYSSSVSTSSPASQSSSPTTTTTDETPCTRSPRRLNTKSTSETDKIFHFHSRKGPAALALENAMEHERCRQMIEQWHRDQIVAFDTQHQHQIALFERAQCHIPFFEPTCSRHKCETYRTRKVRNCHTGVTVLVRCVR
mmetsp:Transcript_38652/g.44515  ORF Transcript_38652/g.44515 Transcript_38652/m.44515 type:complete len:326 (-) Transcript_38652:188-1165(-)